MKRLITAALAATLLVPASAEAKNTTLCEQAWNLRTAVKKRHGDSAPGRNICRYGVVSKYNREWDKPATTRQKARYVRQLKRLLAPPVTRYVRTAAVAPAQSPAGTRTAATRYRGGGNYAIPSHIVQCESGGNYRAYNPSSGAGGAYQIIPSTWRAYGGKGSPHTASPAEQDRIAAKVWAGQGRGAWVC